MATSLILVSCPTIEWSKNSSTKNMRWHLASPMTVPTKTFYSKAILSFNNVVISLVSNNFQIASLSDLQNLSITAFQNATNFLGEKFKELALDNLYYKEITNQQQQLTLLLKGRTDVIIMEERIFLYHLKNLKLSNAVKQQFKIHAIFKPSKRYENIRTATFKLL